VNNVVFVLINSFFLKARDEISDNDSECENDDYIKNTLIATHQKGKDRDQYL
jgi:hypothetical protein